MLTPIQWLTLLVVIVTMIGIAAGRWPVLRVNRTTMPLIGIAILLAARAISTEQAYEAIDPDTLLLLFSMMLLNGFLYLGGFFGTVTQQLVRVARGPRTLLALVIVASGVLSALFLNDTVVLMLTPLVLDTTRALRRDPVPYLLGLATAANVGSVATITGNPQNIVIGSASGIPYVTFTRTLGPVALIGLLICWCVIVVAHRREFAPAHFVVPDARRTPIVRPLLRKSGLVIVGMLVLFVIGTPVALAAFLAAGTMLVTRRLKPERVLGTVDWSLLAFFAGLFVITGSLEVQGLSEYLFRWLAPIANAGMVSFGLASAVLSNLVSNVPAVLLLQGLVPSLPDPNRAWLMLAAASTLAGNLTLLGSVANLIVAEIAMRWKTELTFWAYLRVGVPITVLTLIVAFVLV